MNTFKFPISDHLVIVYAIGMALVWTGLIVTAAELLPQVNSLVITGVACLGIGLSTWALLSGLSPMCEFTLDERGIRQRFLSRTFGFRRDDRFIPWSDVAGYSTLTDASGEVLTLRLRESGRKITFTHSKYLKEQDTYRAFVNRLEQMIAVQPIRSGDPTTSIQKDNNRYGSQAMRILGGLVALGLVAVPGALLILEQPLNGTFLWRVAFVYLLGLPLLYRIFVLKK